MDSKKYIDQALKKIKERNKGQAEFLQAVDEVVNDVRDEFDIDEDLVSLNVLERLTEPDRIVSFRVCWEDDAGIVLVNKGWRVQHSNLIGPYKGGLRFHPGVSESVLKFLAFEQTFKNALTGLPIGGGKGGSDFDPTGRTDREIMRFCQSFMSELYRHIGEKTDVPAGDINVGSREIGYLFGQYRRLANNFSGVITGKDLEFGGSHVRLEATGFGLIYFVMEVLDDRGDSLKEKRVAISGSGNVALHAALKAVQEGAIVISLSSSKGCLKIEDGLSEDEIQALLSSDEDSTEKLKSLEHGEFIEEGKPWGLDCDIALPCATQNEVRKEEAEQLISGQCVLVAEGANMPCDAESIRLFEENRIVHVPGKAANAGGVALSASEMSQNADFSRRDFAELDAELKETMAGIHQLCISHAPEKSGNYVNYRKGANIAAFRRLASAMIAQGIG